MAVHLETSVSVKAPPLQTSLDSTKPHSPHFTSSLTTCRESNGNRSFLSTLKSWVSWAFSAAFDWISSCFCQRSPTDILTQIDKDPDDFAKELLDDPETKIGQVIEQALAHPKKFRTLIEAREEILSLLLENLATEEQQLRLKEFVAFPENWENRFAHLSAPKVYATELLAKHYSSLLLAFDQHPQRYAQRLEQYGYSSDDDKIKLPNLLAKLRGNEEAQTAFKIGVAEFGLLEVARLLAKESFIEKLEENRKNAEFAKTLDPLLINSLLKVLGKMGPLITEIAQALEGADIELGSQTKVDVNLFFSQFIATLVHLTKNHPDALSSLIQKALQHIRTKDYPALLKLSIDNSQILGDDNVLFLIGIFRDENRRDNLEKVFPKIPTLISKELIMRHLTVLLPELLLILSTDLQPLIEEWPLGQLLLAKLACFPWDSKNIQEMADSFTAEELQELLS